ncbi:MAG: Fe-S cluster assembly scaffold protein NifU [Synergistaceae bacterium]|nr:Fe-S cluster assembly scaffold protein NifU [Synergistaceae bacterium]
MYTEKVVDYFMHPRNAGKIDDANAIGEVGNPVCGDVMKIYLKINDKEIIEDIKFETFGCAAAIATSSMVTEMAKGKTISEALKINNKDVAEALGGLPPAKLHCSMLAQEGIEAAIADYFRRKTGKVPEGFKAPTTCIECGGSCGDDTCSGSTSPAEEEELFVSEDHRATE